MCLSLSLHLTLLYCSPRPQFVLLSTSLTTGRRPKTLHASDQHIGRIVTHEQTRSLTSSRRTRRAISRRGPAGSCSRRPVHCTRCLHRSTDPSTRASYFLSVVPASTTTKVNGQARWSGPRVFQRCTTRKHAAATAAAGPARCSRQRRVGFPACTDDRRGDVQHANVKRDVTSNPVQFTHRADRLSNHAARG